MRKQGRDFGILLVPIFNDKKVIGNTYTDEPLAFYLRMPILKRPFHRILWHELLT